MKAESRAISKIKRPGHLLQNNEIDRGGRLPIRSCITCSSTAMQRKPIMDRIETAQALRQAGAGQLHGVRRA